MNGYTTWAATAKVKPELVVLMLAHGTGRRSGLQIASSFGNFNIEDQFSTFPTSYIDSMLFII